jgi:hypothetical protein
VGPSTGLTMTGFTQQKGRHKLMKTSILLKMIPAVLAIASSVSCGTTPVITGKVQDAFGHPVSGANVNVEGTTFTATTDQEGNYSIQYAPGSVTIKISKPGYTAVNFFASLTTASKYPASTVIIFEMPRKPALWQIGNSEYVEMPTVPVSMTRERRLTFIQDHYVVSTNRLPVLQVGLVKFIDNTNSDMRLLQVSPSGELLLRTYKSDGVLDSLTFVEDAVSIESSVLSRRVNLDSGVYAYVKIKKDTPVAGRYLIVGPVYAFRIDSVKSAIQ